MIKLFFSFLLVLGVFACNKSSSLTEYMDVVSPTEVPEIFAPDIVSVQGRLEHGISFTPDMREMAFGILDKEDFSGEIYYAMKKSARWEEPNAMEALKGKSVFLPYFSPDGTSMLFAKSKAVTDNYITDIWILNKNNDTWGHTEKVNSPVSSFSRESSASMTSSSKIYFSSNRDGNGLANLYVSSNEDGTYSTLTRLDSLCTAGDEESIFVASDERFIIFSRYATDVKGPDLYITYQDAKSKWTKPVLLDDVINTSDWERRPFISMDNKHLFYTKLTMNQTGIAESDIYWVTTQQVFKPFVYNPFSVSPLKVGVSTEVAIPKDYFKDIDGETSEIAISMEHASWASYDSENRILTLRSEEPGEFELGFSATDKIGNLTKDIVRIHVER